MCMWAKVWPTHTPHMHMHKYDEQGAADTVWHTHAPMGAVGSCCCCFVCRARQQHDMGIAPHPDISAHIHQLFVHTPCVLPQPRMPRL